MNLLEFKFEIGRRVYLAEEEEGRETVTRCVVEELSFDGKDVRYYLSTGEEVSEVCLYDTAEEAFAALGKI